MGKQGRRKQRQMRKQENKQAEQNGVNPASAVHQLRHPEPKIRHAALVALQATVLHAPKTKPISLIVMQAVREQAMDSNLECASAAAECLAQYLSLDQTNNNESALSATASWTLVLMGRLEQCLQGIQSKKTVKQWYALAAPCLRALCKLIETNELALEQLMNAQTLTFLSTLFGLLQEVTKFEATLDDRLTVWVEDTATYAARTLHSSLDENPEMAQRINSRTDIPVWSQLLTSLPDLAQLHLCGSLVTLYQMSPMAWQSTCLMQQALPCLTKSLVVDGQELRTLEENYHQAVHLWRTQQEDDKLEQDVIRSIEERKESARQIARRQKGTPRREKAVMEETVDGQQAMDDALGAWNGVVLPLQVALEVTANLCTCFIQDEHAMETETDDALDKAIRFALIVAKLSERFLQVLQTLCAYQSSRGDAAQEILTDDLLESISKSAACLANSVLGGLLAESDFGTTWQVLRSHAIQPGVSSVFVVLAQRGPSPPPADMELIQGLLQTKDNEEVQRDAVSLLATVLVSQPVEVVTQATQEFLRLLQEAAPLVQMDVLNTVMDLYGQDDFYPQVFESLDVLTHFQQCVVSISKNSNLEPEVEESLCNANAFVDYKLGR
jgi:hypothetical protein